MARPQYANQAELNSKPSSPSVVPMEACSGNRWQRSGASSSPAGCDVMGASSPETGYTAMIL